jgi:hypothetical protein
MSKASDAETGKALCWICEKAFAASAEHKLKRSDAKATFGAVSQERPIFLHTAEARNQRVQTLNSALLSFQSRLCARCNNELSQPYDRAWERLSAGLRERLQHLRGGALVRTNRIFAYNTRRQMLLVHLFFVKLFLGMIIDGDVPIRPDRFRAVLREGKAHPNVYLKFGLLNGYAGKPVAGASDLWIAPLKADGLTPYATWIYEPGSGVAVMVMYAQSGERREGLVGAWKPSLPTTRLAIEDFDDHI